MASLTVSVDDSAEALKIQGNALFGNGDYGEAIVYYGKALTALDALRAAEATDGTADDRDVANLRTTLLANRAACYLNLNRPWLAMIDCTAVLERDSVHQKALYRRALAFRSMGKHDQALSDLRDLIAQDVDAATLAKVQKIMLPLKQAAAAAASAAQAASSSATTTTAAAGDDDDDDDDDDDEDEGDSNDLDVILGFLEDLSPDMEYDCLYPLLHLDSNWKRWDGGKVGGLPIWLNKRQLPRKEQLTCGTCSEQMSLLLQIYSPIGASEIGGDDEECRDSKDSSGMTLSQRAFHRSLYVFCCRNGRCVERVNNRCNDGNTSKNRSSGICVLRCQLPQINEFYPENPPDPDDEEDHLEKNPDLMIAAEADAAARTAAAKCDERTIRIVHPTFTFPEHEVVTDSEANCKAESDARVMAAAGIGASTTRLNVEEGEITAKDAAEAMASLSTKKGKGKAGEQGERIMSVTDPTMVKFQTVTAIANDQIMRYARWEPRAPLWVASLPDGSGVPRPHLSPEDVPACEYCGAARAFEFQIMPQLLNALRPHEIGGVGEIDWGTLAVYTCTMSCNGLAAAVNAAGDNSGHGRTASSAESAYMREVIWRQGL